MKASSISSKETNWAQQLRKGLVTTKQLAEHGFISKDTLDKYDEVKDNFDIRVPQAFVESLKQGNKALLKQVIPTTEELFFLPEELEDPIGDEAWTPVEGITHRHPDRVLFKPTYLCGVYCRFCFRRYKVSNSNFNLSEETVEKAIQYIADHPEIWEVIFTGGDPLTLTDKKLTSLFSHLNKISHVKVIRFHTRIPSVLPERIHENLIKILKNTNKSVWISLHINSADEYSEDCKKAIALLADSGIPLILQTVLLKDVNDSVDDLTRLFRDSIQNKVKPYYLHYPDLAKGTDHFRIPLQHALDIMKQLRRKISGVCMPTFVVDIPGGHGKIPLESFHWVQIDANTWEFESIRERGRKILVRYP
ncbi:MAG: KamA family radical SAM protein [Silvanigrellaceae bacterium]|nr:KamA family radical SAM protein [Silvanigrellaceae bacterium]